MSGVDGMSVFSVDNDNHILFPIWCFGFNEKVPIINLSSGPENIVLYASAHMVILCDVDGKRQRILRGHCNQITCLTSSKDKRWIASGDAGSKGAVIIWDSKSGDAVRIMIEPHIDGVISIALTEDARYLATLGARQSRQDFSIWNWTNGSDQPLCNVSLGSEICFQNSINFKIGNYSQVLTTGSEKVFFFNWDYSGDIQLFSPTLTDEDFEKRIGSFTGSVYLPDSNLAITVTTQGLAVVWEKQEPEDTEDETSFEESSRMKAIKLVTLHEKSITFVSITRCHNIGYAIVTGDVDGVIKFFDAKFMLVFWFQDINAGPVASIDFASRAILNESDSVTWRISSGIASKNYPQCSTIPGEKFVVEDFIVSTMMSNMVLVTLDGNTIKYLQRDNHEEVTALTTHPKLPLLTTASLTGRIITFDYLRKTVVASRLYDNPIHCCKYSPDGVYIAIGFSDGSLIIADPLTFEIVTKEPFKCGRGIIAHVDFCACNEFCAYSDAAFTTTLLRACKHSGGEPWVYFGRIRAHCRPIVDVRFWQTSSESLPRLFTLGEDRVLTEYDLLKSEKNNIVIRTRFRVEQSSVPLCLGKLPPFSKEDYILCSSTAGKFKLIHASALTCRKTVMTSPTGIQYQKVIPLPRQKPPAQQFILCLSRERLALLMLPLDGDPLKSTNIIAHPSGRRGSGNASCLVTSYDGKFVFTAGGPDTCVHMWGVNPGILEDRVKNAPHHKRRFYELLSPELLNELKDYYYYSMLKVQGLRCFDTRQTSLTIPVTEVPDIMRAIGYYPTEEEIQNMLEEIKYSKFADSGCYVNNVDLDTFIQMYCNYRPATGIQSTEIEEAFGRLCKVEDDEDSGSLYSRASRHSDPAKLDISPEFLMNYLQSLGEPLSEWELTEYFAILSGHYPEGGNFEAIEPVDEISVAKAVKQCLPTFFNAKNFTQRILGLKMCGSLNGREQYALNDKESHGLMTKDQTVPSHVDHELQTE